MRTTKVKRLWPVMALALVFALVAVVGVSLWHSGATPGGLTPPAAEAQDRAIASPTAIPYGTPCVMTMLAEDMTCITGGDSLLVSLAPSTADNDGLAVYVTGAASDSEADGQYPNIQAKSGTGDSDNLGKRGVAEYLPQRAGQNLAAAKITVQRSWADTKGDVFVVVYAGAIAPLGETATKLPASSTTAAGIVRVHFTQPIDLDYDMTIRNLGDGDQENLPGRIEPTGTPTPRRVEIGVAEVEGNQGDSDPGTVGIRVVPSRGSGADRIYLGGRIEVATEFAQGSAVKSGTSLT